MPPYGFLFSREIDGKYIEEVMSTHAIVGVPYTEDMLTNGQEDFAAQADPNADTSGCRRVTARPPSRRART